MPNVNIATIIIVVLIAGVILLLVLIRNRKDEKEFQPENTEDVVEETKTDQQNRADKI